jgi:hypothetical protein
MRKVSLSVHMLVLMVCTLTRRRAYSDMLPSPFPSLRQMEPLHSDQLQM